MRHKKGRGEVKSFLKRIINRLLGRRCGSCAYWRYARFAMGACHKGPFFSLRTCLDSRFACEDWKRNEEGVE